jgi:hypothetical protein
LEPGSVPEAGDLRFWLTTLYSGGFEGGHFTRSGYDANGNTVAVPLHRHEVSLDYTRVELTADYAVSAQWSASVRVPWEQKAQHASITMIEPATPAEREAMIRGMNVHHRNATYRGLGDLMVLAHRRAGEHLSFGAGFTLPTGHTVENPYLLGERGIEHVHIQFGSGTFDPIFEASYFGPVSAFVAARVPLYENSRTFRAPSEFSAGIGKSWRTTDRIRTRAEITAFRQGYGEWDGVRDENTGLVATSATLGATVRLHNATLSADVRVPISQRTLAEGDAFKQGPAVMMTVGVLRRR